jgi:hypothetical protein
MVRIPLAGPWLTVPELFFDKKQQAEYAIQAVRKVDATLQANDYYWNPFAKRETASEPQPERRAGAGYTVFLPPGNNIVFC